MRFKRDLRGKAFGYAIPVRENMTDMPGCQPDPREKSKQ
jgi:hypothetical protein